MSNNSESLRLSYEHTPYQSQPIAACHPDHLAVMALFHGVTPPALSRCRVLELGCGLGTNTLSLACTLPESTFTGIDFSASQIAKGNALLKEAGLTNVTLLEKSILDISPEFGKFDYIICHGIFSWVPKEAQQKILKICRANLSPQGIAYISYNAFPGWHIRGVIKEMMLFGARNASSPEDRVKRAREIVGFMTRNLGEQFVSGPAAMPIETGLRLALKKEADQALNMPDWYYLHDYIAEVNDPLYFSDFVNRAAQESLQYICDAEASMMTLLDISPNTQRDLAASKLDYLAHEQYLDFLRVRMFRRSLICHKELHVERRIKASAIRGLWVASQLTPKSVQSGLPDGLAEYAHPSGGVLKASEPQIKMALAKLSELWPQSIPISELVSLVFKPSFSTSIPSQENRAQEEQTLLGHLLRCFFAELVELHAMPPPFSARAGVRPVASPLARTQSKITDTVCSLRHQEITLDEEGRRLMRYLDGKHDLNSLVNLINEVPSTGTITGLLGPSADKSEHDVQLILDKLARQGLLKT